MGTVRWQFKLDDEPSVGLPRSLNYSGSKTYTNRDDRSIPIAASSTTTVWDPATATFGGPADFDLLILACTVELEVELTTKEGDAAEELTHFTLAANTPFMLGDDAARYDYTTDAFAGTLDAIDKIRVKESNAVAGTLEIRLYT